MDNMEFKALANKVAEACKACTDKVLGCDMCPYESHCVPRKDNDTIEVIQEYQERLEAQKPTQPFGIKGERDKALLNLYKIYNRLSALDKIGYAESEMMRDLIVDIEKLEHARHMEESNEIAKMSIEKLEKFARPMPGIKMDVKQFEEIAKDHYGTKGD